jgi:hypothetical protein
LLPSAATSAEKLDDAPAAVPVSMRCSAATNALVPTFQARRKTSSEPDRLSRHTTYERLAVAAMRGCAAMKPSPVPVETCTGAAQLAPESAERERKMWRLRALVNASYAAKVAVPARATRTEYESVPAVAPEAFARPSAPAGVAPAASVERRVQILFLHGPERLGRARGFALVTSGRVVASWG